MTDRGKVQVVAEIPDRVSVLELYESVVHRAGVGRALMSEVMNRYGALRQLVLMTDDEPGQAAFYRACGLAALEELGGGSLRVFAAFE